MRLSQSLHVRKNIERITRTKRFFLGSLFFLFHAHIIRLFCAYIKS